MRLRTLTEAECYARIYGGHGDERVSVVRLLPRAQGAAPWRESICVSGSRSVWTARGPEAEAA